MGQGQDAKARRCAANPLLSNDDRPKTATAKNRGNGNTGDCSNGGWALTLLEGVLARLQEEYRREGKRTWMEAMRPALTADGAI